MSFNDVSGYGTVVNLLASLTFPTGFVISQFSNDSDPLDMPSVKMADVAMGVNGDLMKWSKAVPLPVTIAVIPGSDDDVNLQILADANRVAQGKISAGDILTLSVTYADGTGVSFIGGVITDAPFGKSVSGDGRLKTKVYTMMFADKVGF